MALVNNIIKFSIWNQRTKQMSDSKSTETKKIVSKQNIGDGPFTVAMVLVGCVVLPFLYYSH